MARKATAVPTDAPPADIPARTTRSKRKTEALEDIATVAFVEATSFEPKPEEGTSDATPASQPKVKKARYSISWSDEGTVAVEIKGAAFKLSSRRLSKESDYFRDRIAKGTDVYDEDGLPLYCIEDSDVDVEIVDFNALLGMLDDAIEFIYTQSTFDNTSSILRASTALSFSRYRNWAILELEKISPADLDDLLIGTRMDNAIDIIWLSLDCNVPSIIKRALYKACTRCTLCTDDDVPNTHRTKLLTTRELLIREWCKYARTSPFDSGCVDGIKDYKSCLAASRSSTMRAYMEHFIRSGTSEAHYDDPLTGIHALCSINWSKAGFCRACVGKAKSYWGSKQKDLWARLDEWFGLVDDDDGEDSEEEEDVGVEVSGGA